MASFLYNNGKKLLLDGTVSFGASTLKVMLVDAGYVADVTHVAVSEASGDEVTGSGYAAGYGQSGRKTLASKTVTVDTPTGRAICDAADLSWSGLDVGTVGGAVVIFETGGSDATSKLIAFLDVADTLTDGSAFPLTFADTGVFYLS